MAYALGPVKPHTKHAAMTLGPMFGIASILGYRASAADMSGHPAGLALDFMTNSKTQGDKLAAYAQANAGPLAVKYIIWWQHIWSVERSSEGWRKMGDRGNPTQNHFDHVHISFEPRGGSGNMTMPNFSQPYISQPVAFDLGGITEAVKNTASVIAWLTDGKNWLRIGAFLAGSFLLLMGIARISNASDNLAKAAVNTAKEVVT